ncbi:MAG: response regulator [Chloroflexi bacterium]|nr:response regulator [Chloroflexota bacterium]
MSEAWRILVVEDEPDGQEVVMDILEYYRIPSDAVGTAEEALKRLAQQIYNGVVIDLALPGMDGFGLLRAIRGDARLKALPCIACTAYHTSMVRKEALEAGFDAYFPKPLDDHALIRELQRLIPK